jgi:LysR family transcriptional regulator (chromosome initiation inhibitor)
LLKMKLDLEQLRTLRAVVEQGTLDAAAGTLHVTPSAVSQRLRALESAAGRVLLVRSKPARPTAAGEAVLRLARQVDLLAADTAAALAGGAASAVTTLGVAVNADSLATWFLPALEPLAGEVAVHVHREDEANTARLLRAGAVVAAITVDPAPVAGCEVTALGAMRYRPVAALAFADRWFPDGPTPDALARAPMLVFDRDDRRQHDYLAARAPSAEPPQTMVPSSSDFAQAIGLGLGWGMVADLQRPSAPPLVELEAHAADVALYLQRWRLRTPSLDRLAEAIIAGGRARLNPLTRSV